MIETYQIVATTYAGLENILAQELINLQADDIQVARRAVYFSGDLELVYRANYTLRTALKVLVTQRTFSIKSVDDLYNKAFKIKWEELFDYSMSFAVQSVVFSDLFNNSMFAGLKVKDAIADRFRKYSDMRPSVDPKNPDVLVNVHISNQTVTISLDSSGVSLHKRGYKSQYHEAPISEVLAAGMLYLSDWDRNSPILDPMCGSGTIAIEAAMMAKNVRPGDIRRTYSFMNWKNFNYDLLEKIQNEANINEDLEFSIYGSDMSRRNIEACFIHAEKALVDDVVRFKAKNFFHTEQTKNIETLIFNPPYGERIESGDKELYGKIGECLKHNYHNVSAWIISTRECLKWIGLRPEEKINLLNGSIECSFRKYSMYQGSKKGADTNSPVDPE